MGEHIFSKKLDKFKTLNFSKKLTVLFQSYDEIIILSFKDKNTFFKVTHLLSDFTIQTGFFEKFETRRLAFLRGKNLNERTKQKDNEFTVVNNLTNRRYLGRYFIRSFLCQNKIVIFLF